MERHAFREKGLTVAAVIAVLFGAVALLLVATQWQDLRQKEREAALLRQETDMVQAAEDLLAEHQDLFEQIAAVLVRQEGPLSIAWEQETWEAEGAVLVDRTGSPESLEPGFKDTVETLFALLPGDGWQDISYRGADRALISIPYDTMDTNPEEGATMVFCVFLEYDGADWSVRAERFGLV